MLKSIALAAIAGWFIAAIPALAEDIPVRDLSMQIHQDVALPNLAELRRAYGHPMLTGGGVPRVKTDMPVPGGIGTGITYTVGQLQATRGANLSATMYVQPNGLNPSTRGLDWLFNTATNRTDDTLEIVAIYNQAGPGSLGVFDWSCSGAWPCAGNVTTPSWMYSTPMSALSCYITQTKDKGGFAESAMQYRNMTSGDGAGNWLNTAFLRNYCGNTWDIIYSHAYAGTLMDCSLNNSCGWWGPIFETFPSTSGGGIPAINRVGFAALILNHNNMSSKLTDNGINGVPGLTSFSYPISPWRLYFINPNRDYVAGNYVAP